MKTPEYTGIYRAEVYKDGKVEKYINFNGKFPTSIEHAMQKRGIECAKVTLIETGTEVGVLDGKVVGIDVWKEAMKPKGRVIEVGPADFAPDEPQEVKDEDSEEKVKETPKQTRVIHANMGHNVSARGKGKGRKTTKAKEEVKEEPEKEE